MNARHGTPGNNRLSNNTGQQRVDFMFSAARTNNSTAGAAENGIIAAASSDDNDADLAEDGNIADRDNPVGSEQREETRLAGEDRGQVQDQMPRRDDEPDINNPNMSSARMNGRSVSGIVKVQLKLVQERNKTMQVEIKNEIRQGKVWDRSDLQLHHHIKPAIMREGWKDFFKMDVYNWVPSVLLSKNDIPWLPMCPNTNCIHKCTRNGFNNSPRIVYGMHENYILNAPERYRCKPCQIKRSTHFALNLPKKEAPRCEWNSLDQHIMEQVKDSNHGMFYEFPCVLSHINALDKSVLKLVQDLAVRGVGPGSVAGMLISWHEHSWQKKEIKWLSHLASRMEEPISTLFGRDENLQDVEKCPSYFSAQCGGGSPSAKYLISTFNRSIHSNRRYFDEEVVRRMKNSIMVAIDASFKVGKWMMRHGDQKIYEALQTGLNEYGEIIMQRWSTSDNHDELETHLKQLKDLGFEPWWIFSDAPEKDRSMLIRVFENLALNVDEDHIERTEEHIAVASNLELIPANLDDCMYIHNSTNAESMMSLLSQDLDAQVGDKVIYFDEGKLLHSYLSSCPYTTNVLNSFSIILIYC
jgi:hypothetical protein